MSAFDGFALIGTWEWQFGGPLARLSPPMAWSVVAALAAVCLAATWFSYRATLVQLSPKARRVLLTLRLIVCALLLIVLANLTRAERLFTQHRRRPVAVAVDRSSSMTIPDYRGQRRLDSGLRTWRQLAPAARRFGGTVTAYAFAARTHPANIDESPTDLGEGETHLFASLSDVLSAAPSGGWGGIVCITDGLDTGSDRATGAIETLIGRAQHTATPLYFIPGRNLTANGATYLAVRDFTLPSDVPPRSSFTLELTIESYQSAARRLPVRLKTGGAWQPASAIFLNAGHHVALWQQTLKADEPGAIPVEVELGEAPDIVHLRASVTVTAPARLTRIRCFEGALDWSRKFLVQALRADPAFDVSSTIHIRPGLAQATDRLGTPEEISSDPTDGLKDVDILIIANTAADQLAKPQQEAVAQWVASGGMLLFVAPDNRAASDFSGTDLERLLPVVFPASPAAPQSDPQVSAYRRRMASLGHSDATAESQFGEYAAQTTPVNELVAFAWEPRAREIFATESEMPAPLFSNYAKVLRAKPGARVLARHPTDESLQGDERAILFATQQYGRGQAAIITCDVLWRWKLHEPSNSRAVEQFWQQLFAWLGRQRQREAALRFDHAPATAEVGVPVALQLSGAEAERAHVSVSQENAVASQLSSDVVSGQRSFRWIPPAAGLWSFVAETAEGTKALHWISVRATNKTAARGEASGLPPDESVMAMLAARTGGAILNDAVPAAWTTEMDSAVKLITERQTREWDRSSVFWLLVLTYVSELILRRHFKLL